MSKTGTKKHPKGLYVLFFTEMWERFGFYLMIGIFALYMKDAWENGGMGFNDAKKSDVYGTYIGLVYLTPFIGGLLADRILGYRKAIFIGGALMSLGYFGLSVHNETIFYISLLFVILGNGFFKPNISTMVGNLYNDERYKANKDSGYNIFYMGINIGAFLCNFVAAYLRIEYGWGWAFAAAGIGMIICLFIFYRGTKHIKEADVLKPAKPGDMSVGKIFAIVLLPMILFGIIGYFIKGVTGPENLKGNIFGTDTNDAFLFGCIPVITFFVMLMVRAGKEDKRPIAALLSVYACLVIFWAVFHQNGDALTTWAEKYSNREVPASAEGVATTLKLAQTFIYDPSVNFDDTRFKLYTDSLRQLRQSAVEEKNNDEEKRLKDLIENREKTRAYFNNLPEEKRPEPGGNLLAYSANIYQSVNPFWVILLTPVVVGIFAWMKRRGREPTTPTKIAIGLLITGLSAWVMVAAVNATDLETDKASIYWLYGTYCVITFGELCLSPMGLSLVSKLAPQRLTSLMMGGFFLATSVGNKLAGILSSKFEEIENKADFFMTNVFLAVAASAMMFLLLRFLNRVMKEKNVY
ncbi:MAG: peptide MFS transporter [Chitinophagales bacterium]